MIHTFRVVIDGAPGLTAATLIEKVRRGSGSTLARHRVDFEPLESHPEQIAVLIKVMDAVQGDIIGLAGTAIGLGFLEAYRDMHVETFVQAWARMEAKGYQYGEDALEQVHFGWQLARGEEDR